MKRSLKARAQEEDDEDDLDSGVLVGVGTRSKTRGFLARGGAGGPPVFMGVGYVEGTEDDEEEDELLTDDSVYRPEPLPSSRKKGKGKGTTSKKKGKGRT